MLERDKDGDSISAYLLFIYVIMLGAMTLITSQKSSLIMFWKKKIKTLKLLQVVPWQTNKLMSQ